MGELAPTTFMSGLTLLGPAQQKKLAEPRVGLLVGSSILLLLLVPVPAPSEVVVIASSTSEPIAISSAAPPRRHVPRLRRGVRVGPPRFLSGARRAHSLPAPLAELFLRSGVAGAAANELVLKWLNEWLISASYPVDSSCCMASSGVGAPRTG